MVITVDGRNRAPVDRYPIIYKVWYIQTLVGFGIAEPSTVVALVSGVVVVLVLVVIIVMAATALWPHRPWAQPLHWSLSAGHPYPLPADHRKNQTFRVEFASKTWKNMNLIHKSSPVVRGFNMFTHLSVINYNSYIDLQSSPNREVNLKSKRHETTTYGYRSWSTSSTSPRIQGANSSCKKSVIFSLASKLASANRWCIVFFQNVFFGWKCGIQKVEKQVVLSHYLQYMDF